MLIDAKIPLARRSALPMLAAAGVVVWIPGFPHARGCEARAEFDTQPDAYLLVEMIRG